MSEFEQHPTRSWSTLSPTCARERVHSAALCCAVTLCCTLLHFIQYAGNPDGIWICYTVTLESAFSHFAPKQQPSRGAAGKESHAETQSARRYSFCGGNGSFGAERVTCFSVLSAPPRESFHFELVAEAKPPAPETACTRLHFVALGCTLLHFIKCAGKPMKSRFVALLHLNRSFC